MKNLSSSVYRTLIPLILSCASFLAEFRNFLSEAMQRSLAPLRRIVSRELEVLEWDRVGSLPQSFIINDHLECGHVSACLTWDIFDLLNAYTNNPEVKAKRHRCHPCASLLLAKKPVQSVGIGAKAGVA